MSGMAHSKPELNVDVLLIILSFAPKQTQSRMMKTCRVLYLEGARKLLKYPVMLEGETQLLSFLLFMRADPQPVRFRSLLDLSLYLEQGISSRLGEVLKTFFFKLARTEHAGLRFLTVGGTEKLLLAVPGLTEAIVSLTSLTSINLISMGVEGSQLLRKLRSHLMSATISYDNIISDTAAGESKPLDLALVLKYSKDTLKELSLTNFACGKWAVGNKVHVYPHLTSLEFTGDWLPDTVGFLRAFPNLNSIEVLYDAHYPVLPPTEPDEEQWRAKQRDYQERYGSWETLRYFHGSLLQLYLLAPICRIENISLDDEQDTDDAVMLRSVLSDARPAHLSLGTWLDPETFLGEDWLGALSERRSPQLQVLDLLMKIMGSNQEDVSRALDNICAAIASLSLEGFKLNIDVHLQGDPEGRLLTFVRDLDVDALAHRIKSTTSSMKALAIALRIDCYDADSAKWVPEYRSVKLGLEDDFVALDLHGGSFW
ncbi:hypothetical protein L226DRAFT_616192 [Lentinus tigrinus ALCF2SS1-7]|uniref:uncharacterized protein n=1 Tax=Lentinus tigrinus ALCF2SS1-7 TaxID=1328758 RepID=UPI0011661EF2|nr:hypothetical protein L226DRAFT_616192 [Lentinus tigrinus ALCF2SS1-7]